MKIKFIYPITFFFFISAILINPLFLKLFTIDNEIHLKSLKIFLYFLSVLNLITFLYFVINLKNFYKVNFFFLITFYVSLIVCILIIELFGNLIISKKNINKKIVSKNYEFNATYIYNNQGFRDKNFKNDKIEKIFLLGDSFVFGSAVDEEYTFDKLLEKKFKNKKIEVFNLGIPGASPDKYLTVLKRFVKFNPSKIIMFLYLDNNIGTVFDQNLLSKVNKILSKSILINLIDEKFYQENIFSKEFVEKFNLDKKYKEIFLSQSANPHALAITYRGELHYHYENLSEIFKKNRSLKNIILEAKKIAENKKADFTIVLIPWKFQIKKQYVNFSKKNLGYDFKNKDIISDNLQKNILTWCLINKIDCLDLTQYLKNSKAYNYYFIDDHFNPTGNELTTNILFDHIQKKK